MDWVGIFLKHLVMISVRSFGGGGQKHYFGLSPILLTCDYKMPLLFGGIMLHAVYLGFSLD